MGSVAAVEYSARHPARQPGPAGTSLLTRGSMRRRFLVTAIASGLAAPAIVQAQDITRSAKAAYRLGTLSRDLEQPWRIAFLPDGRLMITERPGRLRVFANGRLERTPLGGVPKVYARSQAGLLDVC